MNHAHAERIKEPPDIVIHSFGSHLFTILLGMKEFSDLKFGRVISVGSVLYDQILNGVYSSLLVASRLFLIIAAPRTVQFLLLSFLFQGQALEVNLGFLMPIRSVY